MPVVILCLLSTIVLVEAQPVVAQQHQAPGEWRWYG
ncbi:uncharacterized protein METZ01_LOCUS370645, partial [marine metagenome]